MFTDMLFIVMTAFAFFGIYCFIETINDWYSAKNYPPTVTVFKNKDDINTFKKIKYVQENIPNNYTLFYPPGNCGNEENSNCDFETYLKEIMSVNN
ncbi:MAG: hypothetical protein E7483_01660 [Ruminococcaceae bacterium]|nr:hypothetical protein [Oscillospiraceae bacterium]